MPSLCLKHWNATRWLGRAECLEAICKALPYILDHLQVEMHSITNSADVRKNTHQLYHDLTTYEHFLFLFFYRDVTVLLARTSKQLQSKNLQISDVGRYISILHKRLETFYSDDQEFPGELIGEGHAEALMQELFNDEVDGYIIS